MAQCGKQILKSQDDNRPVEMVRTDPSKDTFQLPRNATCSWVQHGGIINTNLLRSRIEPWLSALLQSEHVSLLVGSGLTHAVHGIGTGKELHGMQCTEFGVFDDVISSEVKRVAQKAERSKGNFEDQIRVANELLRGLEIMPPKNQNGFPDPNEVQQLRKSIEEALALFAKSILEGEQNLALACTEKRERAFKYLIRFLMSFANRSGTRERLNLFTTNYDRYIEAGADVAGLRLIDRFVGTLMPIFRASRLDIDMHYNPPGIRGEPRYLEGVAHFTKLHGSIDWVDIDGAIRRIGLPFGAKSVKPYLNAPGLTDITPRRLMIYPNASKDRETASYPYVELFRDFAAAICRPNSTLVCYGYSFGDEHINRVIEDMLTIPSTHLVIISYDDHHDRIIPLYDKLSGHAQVTLMIGDHLADLQSLVDYYLPKPSIDIATIRMTELLKARLGPGKDTNDTRKSDLASEGKSEL